MKRMKRGTAIALTAALVLGLLATALMAASKNWTGAGLGDLSQYYETGNSANPGRISTVPGDPGGKSYGIYMFASKAGTPLSFIKWLQEFKEGSIYRDMGDTLYNAYAYNQAGKYSPGYGSNFDATWERVAESYTSEFTQSQKDFWETHAYADLLANIKSAVPTFDIADYSLALRNVFWSRSVHHGAGVIRGANSSDGRSGATGVILRAFDALGGFKNQSEAEIIQAIYAECSKLDKNPSSNLERRMSGSTAGKYGVAGQTMAYFVGSSGDVQLSVYARLHINEPADAVVMLYQNTDAPLPNGDYRISLHGATSQALAADLSGLTGAASAGGFQFTYYDSGYYTLSINNRRLADSSGKVTLAAPTAGNEQMWALVGDAPYCLQNRATGRYLLLEDKGVSLTKDKKAASRLQITAIGSVWELDSDCTFSKLTTGSYTLTITGTNSAGTVKLAEKRFVVDLNPNQVPGEFTDEEYVISFQVGDTVIESRVYNLTNTYGELPTVDEAGFQGWFREDGTEVSANTPVAASNHTLYARFDDLHTVTFEVDGKAVRTFKLAKGDLIKAPANPVKAADSKYTYSFKQWTDQSGEPFVAGATYMGTKDITYTAQFNKTAKAEGGGTPADPTKPSGGFLTGIAPETSVKSLNDSGYTVYSGKQEVTSGYVGTGMTAVSGSTSLTIVVTGDVNGDGRITITDVVQAAQVTVGQRTI